jgi:hypothetical protein
MNNETKDTYRLAVDRLKEAHQLMREAAFSIQAELDEGIFYNEETICLDREELGNVFDSISEALQHVTL